MVSSADFCKIAGSFPQSEELPHFEKTSFRVKKKIFATLDFTHSRACVKLTPFDQGLFCSFDAQTVYPVPNKWGKQGWTHIELSRIPEDTLRDALELAYTTVAGSKNTPRKK